MTVAILYRDELKEYDFGPGHPFRGDRYELFPPFLKKRLSPDDYYQILAAEPATTEDLLRICDKDYIDFNREYLPCRPCRMDRLLREFQPLPIAGQ